MTLPEIENAHDTLYAYYTRYADFSNWADDELLSYLNGIIELYREDLYNYEEWLKEYHRVFTRSELDRAREQVQIYGAILEGLTPNLRACKAEYNKRYEVHYDGTRFPIEEADAKLNEFKTELF
jgi:hypothetical protein